MFLMRIGEPGQEKPVVRVAGWLQSGDVMDLGIDVLGTQRQTVVGPR